MLRIRWKLKSWKETEWNATRFPEKCSSYGLIVLLIKYNVHFRFYRFQVDEVICISQFISFSWMHRSVFDLKCKNTRNSRVSQSLMRFHQLLSKCIKKVKKIPQLFSQILFVIDMIELLGFSWWTYGIAWFAVFNAMWWILFQCWTAQENVVRNGSLIISSANYFLCDVLFWHTEIFGLFQIHLQTFLYFNKEISI